MAFKVLLDSIDSGVFFVEQISSEPSPQRNNFLKNLHSTELSGMHKREMPTLSSVPSTNQILSPPTTTPITQHFFPGLGHDKPLTPPSLNDLNLPPNPFNVLATMRVVQQNPTQHDDNYRPQSPEPSEPPPISAPSMNLNTIGGWDFLHTTTDDNNFYSEDEPIWVHWISPRNKIFIRNTNPEQFNCCPVHPHHHRLARWSRN